MGAVSVQRLKKQIWIVGISEHFKKELVEHPSGLSGRTSPKHIQKSGILNDVKQSASFSSP